MKKRWLLLSQPAEAIERLASQLNITPLLAELLLDRGILSLHEAKAFFNPSLDDLHDPFLMKDMQKAVERLEHAFNQNERILVYGDYDVDGTTAVASFYQFLHSLYDAEQIDYYIPNRYKEGYGISKKGIDFAAENNFKLVVCLDCGIKSVELIDYAKTLGIDFIICDHHQPGATIPDAIAVLNPKQVDCNYPYKDLCGCGVGFKLMMAYAIRNQLPSEQYLCYLDLVAIAIAADIVPMTGENRILASFGLKKINTNPCKGVAAIKHLAGATAPLSISNVVFLIAPRINAAGRMDDAKKAVELFISSDETKAMELAGALQTDNNERKEKDSDITAEALGLIQSDKNFAAKKSCVLFAPHWHKGVVGIVASRVIEHHYRPTIILTEHDGIATGSARSIKGFNLHEAIYECREYLTAFGGHFAAAGLSLLPENIPAFSAKFDSVVQNLITDEMLTPSIEANAIIHFDQINQPLYNTISRMEPFGPENMKPVFWSKNVVDNGHSRVLKEKHLKFELSQQGIYKTGIGFNMADKISMVTSGQPFEIIYTIDENHYKGSTTLQLMVIDCRPMGPS